MTEVYLSLGSNIRPEENISSAILELKLKVAVRAVSTVYLTRPVERPSQPDFYNCVLLVETDKRPAELKEILRWIESRLKRRRTADRHAPRTIDIDILLFGALVTSEHGLAIPDPEIRMRPFLLKSLSELAPDLRIPGEERSVGEIASLIEESGMTPLPVFTARLREIIS